MTATNTPSARAGCRGTAACLYFCGHYAVSGNSWRRVMELKPKLSKHVAWEDLDRYVDDISSKAVEREENERKATP